MSETRFTTFIEPDRPTGKLRLYFTYDPERLSDPDYDELNDTLSDMGIAWPATEPYAEGFHMIQAAPEQLEDVEEAFRTYGFWMFLCAKAPTTYTVSPPSPRV